MKTKYAKPTTSVHHVQARTLVALSDPSGTGQDIPWGVKGFNTFDDEKLPSQKDLWKEEW